MRITSKGQVTIPADIREKAGLLPDTEVDFESDGKVVRIMRAKSRGTSRSKAGRGGKLIAHMRGRGDVAMSTAAIMALTRDPARYRSYFPTVPPVTPDASAS
jgi:AbrB family looped-hinge helix DNA binding protein